ncbi:MAG: hypothetical protein L6Q63_15920 [Giesbergeria sp.]|nr:hypothetical protein [Giesbergeria sp.]
MARSNIGQRLGLLLASFSLLAALLLGYLTYTAARDLLVERAQHTLLDTTRILSSHLQTGFVQLGRDASMLATLAGGLPLPGGPMATAAQNKSLETLAQVFRAQLLARPGLLQVRLIGLRDHGLELVRLQRLADERIVRVEGAALQEKAHFPYVYETARLTSGGVYFTEFGINREDAQTQEERAVFSVAAPVVQATAVVGGWCCGWTRRPSCSISVRVCPRPMAFTWPAAGETTWRIPSGARLLVLTAVSGCWCRRSLSIRCPCSRVLHAKRCLPTA